MATTTTPKLGLKKNADGDYGWGQNLRDNADLLDTAVGTEHNTDGTHKTIHADAVMVTGDIQVGGSSLANELAAAAQATNERIAAEAAAAQAAADRIAAEAAWTAALAANPDLNPQVRMNPAVVTQDLAIPDGYNAYAAGPLEVAHGVTITVGANAALAII